MPDAAPHCRLFGKESKTVVGGPGFVGRLLGDSAGAGRGFEPVRLRLRRLCGKESEYVVGRRLTVGVLIVRSGISGRTGQRPERFSPRRKPRVRAGWRIFGAARASAWAVGVWRKCGGVAALAASPGDDVLEAAADWTCGLRESRHGNRPGTLRALDRTSGVLVTDLIFRLA